MRRHRQSANPAVCTSDRRMSQWLLPATADHYDRSSDSCHLMPWRYWSRRHDMQLTFLRHIRWTDDLAAVCSECCCTSRVRRSTVWPHHAGTTPAALTSGSEAGGLQDGHLGLPFVVRHGYGLHGRKLCRSAVKIVILGDTSYSLVQTLQHYRFAIMPRVGDRRTDRQTSLSWQ